MIWFSEIAKIAGGSILGNPVDREVKNLFIDSRKAVFTETSLFFAISGERHDGHHFIEALYKMGIRQFIVEKKTDISGYPLANILEVDSSVRALQAIAAHHRREFSIPVIGLAGSNGKTIIKEWLSQLLSKEYAIVKNPGSYNSQIGVPLSVWQIQAHHQLGIFEAGISQPGEMQHLQSIILPTVGIFTNIGSAHDEGFVNEHQKIEEKMKLFSKSEVIIFCEDHAAVALFLSKKKEPHQHLLSWGFSSSAEVRVVAGKAKEVSLLFSGKQYSFTLPFSDSASKENVIHCIVTLLYFGISGQIIQERISTLRAVPMRLELKQGINQCQIIDDTYNNDLQGLQISLNFLSGTQKKKKTLIVSDILQSGMQADVWVGKINELVQSAGVNSFIGIGHVLHAHQQLLETTHRQFFRTTEEFLLYTDWEQFQQEVILVKGARVFQFEKIVQRLQRKIHGTVMEINLDALVHNLNFFKSKLKPSVKMMVMVKAFAYGSGSEEVAGLLQYHKVDYLGVAYTDEGVDLRKNRITLPIMVMNPGEENFETLLEHHLEPEIYSLRLLRSLIEFLKGKDCKVHIKIDTGMHRLGFEEKDIRELISLLKSNRNIQIASIFSHLAGADDPTHDDFTRAQSQNFLTLCKEIKTSLGIQPVVHLLNSPGILRFPDLQFDMVRLGIGLYGVNPTEEKFDQLIPAATLKTVISQIKKIKPGETIGYGRRGKARKEMMIATIAIGYADGFSRSFSRGKGEVLIREKRCPVIGNVCMDMTMIDITDTTAQEGDEVIIFGGDLSIQEVAEKIDTIPYEILTSTSERVKRLFYAESI